MNSFGFGRVSDPVAAIAAVAGNPDAKFVAGGTTLIDLMKEGVERPRVLVDINALPLGDITEDPRGLRVGAMVRNSDLALHPVVRERYAVLSQALLAGASGQLRNMATLGGNLMQRTRCSYFRDTAMPCNRRQPGSGCGAMEGINRLHAVLGTSASCIATHPSDMSVALVALDAIVHIAGPWGERAVAARDFHRLPGERPDIETVLVHGELITAVTVPSLPPGMRSAYLKVRDRASYEFALASAAVALHVEKGAIADARIALGGIATKPWRAHEAEQLLIGKPPRVESLEAAAEAALSGAVPRQQNIYKIELAKRTIVSALYDLVEAA